MWERIAPCSKVSTTSVPGKVTQRNMFREIFSNIQVIQNDINKLEQRTSTMRVIACVSLYSNSKKSIQHLARGEFQQVKKTIKSGSGNNKVSIPLSPPTQPHPLYVYKTLVPDLHYCIRYRSTILSCFFVSIFYEGEQFICKMHKYGQGCWSRTLFLSGSYSYFTVKFVIFRGT